MRRVLLVDDDPIILRIYRKGLEAHGLEVETAEDGLAALKALRASKPDIMVLDLMMPRLSGAEVLKCLRAEPELADLPVIVLSNVYMSALGRDAAVAGADKGLLKVRCTPAILFTAINETLQGTRNYEDSSVLLAVPRETPTPQSNVDDARAAGRPAAAEAAAEGQQAAPPPRFDPNLERELRAKARQDFLARLSVKCLELRLQFQDFDRAKTESEWRLSLEAVYRQMHFLAAEAGLAGCGRMAMLASALEALIQQLMDNPSRITPSVRRTLRLSMNQLSTLAQQAHEARPEAALDASILLVDDDPISNRLVLTALRQVELQARSLEDPLQALKHLQEKHYDLLLLDIGMPGMNGFELCQQLRKLPGYERTPVVYVTGHTEFEHLAKSLELGAEDLLAKPILPTELAVKVLIHLLRRQQAKQPA